MALEVNGKIIETDEEGFLVNLDDWSEEIPAAIAAVDGFELKDDHEGLIDFFREYYEEHQTHPTMHQICKKIGGCIGDTHKDHKALGKHIYKIFNCVNCDPVAELCKLAGLPKPLPDGQ